MKKANYLPLIFIVGIGLIITSMWGIITRKEWAFDLLVPALIAGAIVFILIGVEIWNSANIENSEKIMWTIGLVFMGTITTIIYFLAARKRITKEDDPFHPPYKTR